MSLDFSTSTARTHSAYSVKCPLGDNGAQILCTHMHRVKEFTLFYLWDCYLLARLKLKWGGLSLCQFFIVETMVLLFGENSSIQRALMISASAATTAEILQSPTDLGDVTLLENTDQPISWLAPSLLLVTPSASWLPVSSAREMMPDGQVIESCLLASNNYFITVIWVQLGMYCSSLQSFMAMWCSLRI